MIMKTKTLSFALALFFLLSAFVLTSCGNEDEIVTEVRFTVYDNGDGDMISFYMTSDTEPYGVWESSVENAQLFETFHSSNETNDYGLLGWGGTASYKTLVLKPVSEGETVVSFKLTEGDKNYKFSVKTVKNDDKFKIEAKQI